MNQMNKEEIYVKMIIAMNINEMIIAMSNNGKVFILDLTLFSLHIINDFEELCNIFTFA